MNSVQLNEHDANQGAQSSGEFLGMSGNSGWYLLGAAGSSIMVVVVLWGILGVSLLLCLLVGLILCLGAVAYVFMLKNNKPEHYDTDFFEAALVESGVLQFRFGPRSRRPLNPFSDADDDAARPMPASEARSPVRSGGVGERGRGGMRRTSITTAPSEYGENAKSNREQRDEVVARGDYERLREKLSATEELLEEVLTEAAAE